ncbi:MAG: type IX secretion system protein PorQ [Luteibaculaceae bacterium]
MKIKILFVIFLQFAAALPQAFAQLGGDDAFRFISLPGSARVGALGGNVVSILDDDINMALPNPGILNPKMDRQIALNYNSLFADIGYGFASYAQDFKEHGTFATHLQFMNYGNFERRDATGELVGNFTAGEYALNLQYSRALDSLFRLGIATRFIYSSLEDYVSTAIAVDIGVSFNYPEWGISAGAVLRNYGRQLRSFTERTNENLPFQIDLGVTKKLKNAPLRFTLTTENWQTWDLSFVDPTQIGRIDPLTGQPIPVNEPGFGDILMRHVVVGGEILLSKNFHVRVGYNYRRRAELALSDRPGLVGLSWGFGMKISKFQIHYGSAMYHLAGSTNMFSLVTKFDDFKKKPQVLE